MCCFSDTMRIHLSVAACQKMCGSRKSGMFDTSTGLSAYFLNVMPPSVLTAMLCVCALPAEV